MHSSNALDSDTNRLSANGDALPSHIGAEFAALRAARGLSIKDVAQKLIISPDYVSAIESLNKDALPSFGYVLGYVRSYASLLGMNAETSVKRYKVDSELSAEMAKRGSPHFVARREIRLPKGSLAAGLILSCFTVLAVWYGMSSDAQSTQLVSRAAPVQANLGLAVPKPTLGDPDVVSIRATGPSWVEIKDARGDVIVSRIFVSGEIFETRKDTGLALSARDGGALQLYRGGNLVGAIGVSGQRLTDIALR